MKRKILFFISLATCYLLLTTSFVFAAEKINDFNADVVINTDGAVNVVETIVYDFDNLSRHGIYRTIPFVKKNLDGKKYQMDFQVLSVADENQIKYTYQILKEGTNLKIKIGDPDRTITGVHTYIITYRVSGALTYFSDHDELYWNVTGNDWPVPINQVSSVVNLPQEAAGQIKTICYTGVSGSKLQFCKAEQLSPNSYKIVSDQALNPYEGLTLAVFFPKNIVMVVEPREYGKKTLFQTILSILFAIGLFLWYVVAPFGFFFLWLKYGRDPNVGRPVTATFDPPKDKTGRFLTPGEVGTLVDEKADSRDLTGTIVSLAIKGYLKIKEEKKKTLIFASTDYTFIKTKDYCSNVSENFSHKFTPSLSRGSKNNNSDVLQEHELLILEKLFKNRDQVSTSDLKDNFYVTYGQFQKDLYQKVVDLSFFPENPNSVRTKYYLLSGLSLITMNFPLAIIGFIVSNFMPRKTLDGAKANIQAHGLKNFLVTQERQLEFQVKNWFMFEKLLPYAIIFGVEKIWADRFSDLKAQPPDWYEGDYGRTFNTIYFTNSLSNSLTSMNSMTMSPTRSSSGFSSGFSGGSSGGGGGGGGGGSW